MSYASLFLSDLHLGSGLTNTDELIKLLKDFNGDRIFLLGDIIDLVAMRKKVRWDSGCNKVIKKLFKLVRNGTEVYYIPGNHDANFRQYHNEEFNGIKIFKKMRITLENGNKVLLMHGDEFDGVIKKMTWLYGLGDFLYGTIIRLNKPFNKIRRIFGFTDENFSLSMYLKSKVKDSIKIIGNFEGLVVEKGKKYDADYVMCGHIHIPEMKKIGDITYCNTGCFTEICSYIIEHYDGQLELKYLDKNKKQKSS
jgi:UDP-2,3-diacylglucosamine pyrophosphatase LpxH